MASYRQGIRWIVDNDDVTEIEQENFSVLISMAIVADLFSKTDEQVIADVKKEIAKKEREKIAEGSVAHA